MKSRIKTAIASVTAMLPFCREFGGNFKDAWSSQSITKDIGLSILNSNFCFFILLVDYWLSIKIVFCLSKNVSLCMVFTNSKTIQTKTKVFIHLNLFVFYDFSFLSAFTKYRLTQKVLKPHTSNFNIKNGSNSSCPGRKFVKIHL